MQLVFGDAGFSAHGRMDIDSKRATDHQGSFELRQLFQVHGDKALGRAVDVQAGGFAQVFGDEGADAHADRDAAEAAFDEIKKQTCEWSDLVILNTLRAGHGFTSINKDVKSTTKVIEGAIRSKPKTKRDSSLRDSVRNDEEALLPGL